jgi:Holliday junction resolvase RusA-like endonuclease
MQGLAPLQNPIKLTINAFLAIPASWSTKKQEAAAKAQLSHTSRPDLDNIVKAVKDGLNKIVWRDDAQVVICNASKQYGHQPRVDISVLEQS